MASNLDIHHISTVCDQTAQRAGLTGLTITQTPGAVRIRASSVDAAGQIQAALTRVGYTVDRPRYFGRRDELTIPGWNRDHLTARITALRDEINGLDTTRRDTAATAIDHAVGRPEITGRTDGSGLLADIQRELRHGIEQRAGIIAPVNPRALPADPDIVRLLRTAHRLEQHVTTRIQRHAHTAELAVRLYDRYRQHTRADNARAAAIHDAYLNGRPRQATPLERQTGAALPRPPGHGLAAGLTADSPGKPPTLAARDVAGTATDAAASQAPPGARPSSPASGAGSDQRAPRRGR